MTFVVDEMKTYAARLDTFDVVHPAPKRTSGTKGTKGIAWPHSSPSPAELAHAGFYYNPSPASPDNASCFLCGRGLDGWEEDDDPIQEHLTHSSECGWAIMVNVSRHSSNPAEIEDPTSAKMVEARRSTFLSSWPHEGKRGWVCKTEKMIEAGWYFCPNEESEDFVSCAYCQLSLDGWEPKDDPYDEHYRRSSECSFFAFSPASGKKATRQSRAKKTRASKTSRTSTQSNATTASDAGTVDVDDTMDQSTLSQATTKSRTTKKTTRAKAKGGRPKKEESTEPVVQVDPESNAGDTEEKPRPKRAGRGKKRTSDEIDDDEQLKNENDGYAELEQPPKKRNTKARNTTAESIDSDVDSHPFEAPSPKETVPKRATSNPRGGKKKQSSLSTRKPSAESAASKASLRSRVPDDTEIEAEIEAGLENDMTDDEIDAIPQEPTDIKYQASSASVAPVRAPKRSKNSSSANETVERSQSISEDEYGDIHPKAGRKIPAKRKVAMKNAPQLEDQPSQNLESSTVSVEIRNDDSGNDADAGTSNKPVKKGGKKKAPGRKAKKPATERETAKQTKRSPLPEVSEHSDPEYDAPSKTQTRGNRTATKSAEVEVEDDDQNDNQNNIAERQSSVSEAPEEPERHEDENSNVSSPGSSRRDENQQAIRRPEPSIVNISSPAPPAPPTPMQKHTPSPSPQSSDAENQPPSTRPSANRPPVLSPSKKVNIAVPLAASTPSASPSKRNAGRILNTSYPWSPTDVEEILVTGSLDKENVDLTTALNEAKGGLDSPQKKMTVEEWILWNSKNGEEKLRRECERLVGIFEKEGGRAMMALEGIECIE